ncbi:MAG: hypothetical protein ACI8P0_006293 [Planctomycetaceae bacterium]|jgi:hypothetical protein
MSTGEPQQLPETEEVDLGPNFIERHGKQIAFGVIALVILFGAASYVVNNSHGDAEKRWSEFAAAQSASDFANVASDFPGTDVAVWARLTEGEMQLREAVQLQFSDRAAAGGKFKSAGEALESVLGNADLPTAARERALLGQARLLEANSDGNLDEGNMDEVILAYKKVKGIQGSIYASLVESRIEALQKEDTQSFYAWFSQQNPKPEDRARPQDGLPSGHPELPVSLPPIPDELFPADWSDLKIDDAPPFEIPAAGDAGKADAPAEGDAPAPETPADGDVDKAPAGDAAATNDAAKGDAAKDDATSESSPKE